jgi:hypothetical protein
MSITEKLARLDIVRLARIHSSLKAKDWIEGAMYDEEQNISMDKWAELVQRELQNRKKGKVTA